MDGEQYAARFGQVKGAVSPNQSIASKFPGATGRALQAKVAPPSFGHLVGEKAFVQYYQLLGLYMALGDVIRFKSELAQMGVSSDGVDSVVEEVEVNFNMFCNHSDPVPRAAPPGADFSTVTATFLSNPITTLPTKEGWVPGIAKQSILALATTYNTPAKMMGLFLLVRRDQAKFVGELRRQGVASNLHDTPGGFNTCSKRFLREVEPVPPPPPPPLSPDKDKDKDKKKKQDIDIVPNPPDQTPLMVCLVAIFIGLWYYLKA